MKQVMHRLFGVLFLKTTALEHTLSLPTIQASSEAMTKKKIKEQWRKSSYFHF